MIVPARNVVPKPAELSWAEAACLSTAWLTAYRMLFTKSGLRPGQTVLVQGASGGVASACIAMARAAGFRVYATARTEDKQAAALELGAHEAFASGARLPERVDAVMETVGDATWSHSLKSLKPGGRIVVSGATSGAAPVRGPEPGVLPAIAGDRLDDGHQGRARRADRVPSGDRACVRASTAPSRWSPPPRGSRRWQSGDLVGKIVLEF